MIVSNQFIFEQLIDEQRKNFSHVCMTDKARADTDHFFGKDNDIVYGEISNDAGHIEHKSEIHRAVERHIGQKIHQDDYNCGIIKDKYGRDINIVHLIKDEKLKNEFLLDNTRKNSKKDSLFKTTTVRGIKIIDKTNNVEDLHHSKEYSQHQLNSMSFNNGLDARQYLENEIRHGTVVHRVHDHAGQEIYHATLQPYHNDQGHVAYDVDSEYGINHPVFTKTAVEVAKRLSGEYKPGLFKKHPDVYSENEKEYILHPNATAEHLHKALNDKNKSVRIAAARHPNLNSDHLHKALNDKNWTVRAIAASHPNANAEHLHKALNDENAYVREAAARNPNYNK
jgi:hypothetical protein